MILKPKWIGRGEESKRQRSGNVGNGNQGVYSVDTLLSSLHGSFDASFDQDLTCWNLEIVSGVLRIPFGAFAATCIQDLLACSSHFINSQLQFKKVTQMKGRGLVHLGSLAVCCASKQLVEFCDKQLVSSGQVVPEIRK